MNAIQKQKIKNLETKLATIVRKRHQEVDEAIDLFREQNPELKGELTVDWVDVTTNDEPRQYYLPVVKIEEDAV